MCITRKFEPISCFEWEGSKPASLYIVDLKTEKMQELSIPCLFTFHHVNAYDEGPDTIIMDVSSYPSPSLLYHLQLEILRDPMKRNSGSPHATLKRLRINLSNGTVDELPLDLNLASPSLSSFLDMPVINEQFRSKFYCYVYGLVPKSDNLTLSDHLVVKKDLCGQGKLDRSWKIAGHSPSEPWFVPSPHGMAEDDGLLMVPVLDFRRAVTYLAVLDAMTMTLVNQADMPTYIPLSLHGRYFELDEL